MKQIHSKKHQPEDDNKSFDYQAEIEYVAAKYRKHGVTVDMVKSLANSGIKRGISQKARIIGVRMVLSRIFNEEDYFSVEDAMEITGESREEIIYRMKQAGITPVTISTLPGLMGGNK